jgi:hypothetical protein
MSSLNTSVAYTYATISVDRKKLEYWKKQVVKSEETVPKTDYADPQYWEDRYQTYY